MKNIYRTLTGITALTLFSATSCKIERIERPIQQVPSLPQQVQPVPQTAPVSRDYVVQNGDFLSRIIYGELGLTGRAIYDALPEIQRRSGFGPERDTHMVVDGKLVNGQDGYVDLIYPGRDTVRLR